MGLRRDTTDDDARAGRFAMPRSRGAASGLLLLLLGLWGGLAPFIGPYLGLSFGSDRTWDFTAGRFWLSLLPAAAVVFGALLLLRSAHRATAGLGAWAAIAGGIWFVIGPLMSTLWTSDGQPQTGAPLGGTTRQLLEWMTYHYALGALITAIAGVALGRVSARLARDVERLEPAPRTAASGRFTRDDDADERPVAETGAGNGRTERPLERF